MSRQEVGQWIQVSRPGYAAVFLGASGLGRKISVWRKPKDSEKVGSKQEACPCHRDVQKAYHLISPPHLFYIYLITVVKIIFQEILFNVVRSFAIVLD